MVYLPKVIYHWEVCPTWRWLYLRKYAILKNPLVFRETPPLFDNDRPAARLQGANLGGCLGPRGFLRRRSMGGGATRNHRPNG